MCACSLLNISTVRHTPTKSQAIVDIQAKYTSVRSYSKGKRQITILRANQARVEKHEPSQTHDIVLSSGFMSFANHSGFLQAVEDKGIPVSGIMGTSAGALTGSLYAAGYSPKEILQILCEKRPIEWLSPPTGPWGALSLSPVVNRLKELLPETFEELDREFACGIVKNSGLTRGEYVVVDSGPLVEAVVASAAIPLLFTPVPIPGQPGSWMDGGMEDRVGLRGWRTRRRNQGGVKAETRVPPVLAHVIARSSKFSGDDNIATLQQEESEVLFVQSPKSGKSLLSVGDYETEFQNVVSRVGVEIESGLLL